MIKRRGQTATEYLIILSVVIVIAIIVVGVLGGIPSIGGGLSVSANAAQLSTQKIGVLAYSVSDNSTVINLRNNEPDRVKINSLKINDTSCATSDLPAILNPGQKVKVICSHSYSITFGETYSFPLNISWDNLESKSTYFQDVGPKLIGVYATGVTSSEYVAPLSQSGAANFTLINSTSSKVATFTEQGHIVLTGNCSNVSCSAVSSALLVVRNSTMDIVAYVNSTGDMCVSNSCSDSAANCNSPSGNSFVIRDSGKTIVSYIDGDGALCLTGNLVEVGSP